MGYTGILGKKWLRKLSERGKKKKKKDRILTAELELMYSEFHLPS